MIKQTNKQTNITDICCAGGVCFFNRFVRRQSTCLVFFFYFFLLFLSCQTVLLLHSTHSDLFGLCVSAYVGLEACLESRRQDLLFWMMAGSILTLLLLLLFGPVACLACAFFFLFFLLLPAAKPFPLHSIAPQAHRCPCCLLLLTFFLCKLKAAPLGIKHMRIGTKKKKRRQSKLHQLW